jgi:hypothetical protein
MEVAKQSQGIAEEHSTNRRTHRQQYYYSTLPQLNQSKRSIPSNSTS